jgi:hypothetical protein
VTAVLLYLRLAVATGVVLAPGLLVARAVGVRGLAATLAWALTVVFAALSVTFALSGSLTLTLVLLLAAGAAALPFAVRRRPPAERVPGRALAAVLGCVLGLLLWHVAGEIGGDGLFHLARARKLLDFGDLSLDAANEFPDGSLHPGYAFPLWHGLLALVAKVAAVDPADVVLHLPSILAPLAVVLWLEAGWAVFRQRAAACAAAGAAVCIVAMAPAHGGAYTALALPATASRQLLVPAVLALAFTLVRRPSWPVAATVAAASLALAVVHPTYAVFLAIPFAGFVLVRLAWMRADGRTGALALAALAAPVVGYALWLLPVATETQSVSPGTAERARAIAQYQGQLDIRSSDSFSVAPELFGRAGAIAVAALLLVPLAALAARRRWAAYVVGGSLAVFAITLVPFLFVPFSDLVSISQARRLVGFLPFPFAFAGGIGVSAALLGPLTAPVALVGGIVLQLAFPGDFDYRLTDGGPALVTWVSVAGALVALVVGVRRQTARERNAGLASALALLPVVAHGLANWSPSDARPPSPLSPGLVQALREQVPEGATVYSDPEASYRIAAFAPVRVCVAPPGHVADTVDNRPYERIRELRRFLATGDLEIPRSCGAGWLVLDRRRFDRRVDLPAVYRDARWALYRLAAASGGTSG